MVFNATFNNISVMWWRSVLLHNRKIQQHYKLHRKSFDICLTNHYHLTSLNFSSLKHKMWKFMCEKVNNDRQRHHLMAKAHMALWSGELKSNTTKYLYLITIYHFMTMTSITTL